MSETWKEAESERYTPRFDRKGVKRFLVQLPMQGHVVQRGRSIAPTQKIRNTIECVCVQASPQPSKELANEALSHGDVLLTAFVTLVHRWARRVRGSASYVALRTSHSMSFLYHLDPHVFCYGIKVTLEKQVVFVLWPVKER